MRPGTWSASVRVTNIGAVASTAPSLRPSPDSNVRNAPRRTKLPRKSRMANVTHSWSAPFTIRSHVGRTAPQSLVPTTGGQFHEDLGSAFVPTALVNMPSRLAP
jgi:hypothetical protein